MRPIATPVFTATKQRTPFCSLFLLTAFIFIFSSSQKTASAMPMFARKHSVPCSTCHTSPPKLNEAGYKFRVAGFRFPGEDGSQKDFNFLDYSSVRLQLRYDASRTEAGTTTTDSYRFRVQAVEAYPLTGAWGKHFSTNFKVSWLSGDGSPTIENAHVRYTREKAKTTYTVRAGIFHLYDGYEASDSPATISRPLMQTQTASFEQNTFFRTWGFDQLGVEVGLDHRRTSIRAAIFNGVELHRTQSGLRAYSAQGGPLTREAALPSSNTPDFQVFVNQRLTRKGGSLALHYYHGNITLPTAAPVNSFRNHFDRLAAYGSYPLAKRLNVAAGYQYGQDDRANGQSFKNQGAFVEASTPLANLSEVGFRYDFFDPARNRSSNETNGITTYANLWFKEQFRVVAEYQHRETTRGTLPTQAVNAFQMRLIFIK
ncbi:MAG TPA: hypothetical protein VFZ34_01245 [Blastocatellia bacterium]|nr:hypothetical protein [Blastocatellia bacterium]